MLQVPTHESAQLSPTPLSVCRVHLGTAFGTEAARPSANAAGCTQLQGRYSVEQVTAAAADDSAGAPRSREQREIRSAALWPHPPPTAYCAPNHLPPSCDQLSARPPLTRPMAVLTLTPTLPTLTSTLTPTPSPPFSHRLTGVAYLGCASGALMRLRLSPLRVDALIRPSLERINALVFRPSDGGLTLTLTLTL